MQEKSDPRVGCTFPSNLVELIETYIDLEEEFKEFESAFEQDEIKFFFDENNNCSFS